MDTQDATNRPMGPPTIQAADSMLFFSPDQVASMELPAEARFVMFFRGKSPQVLPLTDPGTYEVDCAILENGEWPVLVSVLPLDKVGAFQQMTPEHVGRILDRVQAQASPARDGGDDG